ncbi:MAG: polysaccharide export outer membrane protein [Arenicella sp.]|jgi:polysaccharide export outer membrane protein
MKLFLPTHAANLLFRDSCLIQLKLIASVIIVGVFLSGCASSKGGSNRDSFDSAQAGEQSEINQRISNSAVLASADLSGDIYKLGVGDILELTVFQVEALNTKVRVNGRGEIILPLLGKLNVEGKPVSAVENEITELLKKEYLQDPQVSLFIEEYRSQQITVMGAVGQPNVYSVRQSRSIFEMLSLAGGLNEEASDQIRVATTQVDPETGESVKQNLILSVKRLLAGAEVASYLRLSGGDSILVPRAGVVFVEGAVNKPGSYSMEGDTTVLKAIALAGGVPWEGNQGRVQVVRDLAGESFAININLNKIRTQQNEDIVLRDGDIVIVNFSGPKRFVTGFFNTVGNMFGYRLN